MKCFLLRLFSPLLSTTRICDFLRCQLLLGFDKIIICRIEEIKHEGDAADNKYPNQNTKVYITSRRETFKVYFFNVFLEWKYAFFSSARIFRESFVVFEVRKMFSKF